MTKHWSELENERDLGHRAEVKTPVPHEVHVKKFYTAPRKTVVIEPEENFGLADDGTYVVVWTSVLRDLATLFFEGVGIVILGHYISVVAVVMLAGLFIGIFAVRQKVKRERKR